jgi:hypothetical protein
MGRVQIVQMPDGQWVQQYVEETSIVNNNVIFPQQPPPIAPTAVIVQQPQVQVLPPPKRGFFGTIAGTFNGDLRWNPVTRQYERVELNRPERTGFARRMLGR